jgi:hypothetical protein
LAIKIVLLILAKIKVKEGTINVNNHNIKAGPGCGQEAGGEGGEAWDVPPELGGRGEREAPQYPLDMRVLVCGYGRESAHLIISVGGLTWLWYPAYCSRRLLVDHLAAGEAVCVHPAEVLVINPLVLVRGVSGER